ncbi:MAG TPA: helix-turn-helix domain-containing protein [Candidatus Lumbricidophila sp.]|nr:helix-turn-helix domain-containing protein [Candidatus Lumbricidophila sp.]
MESSTYANHYYVSKGATTMPKVQAITKITDGSAINPGALNPTDAALYLGKLSPVTLRDWRKDGIGPAFVRLGATKGRVVYRIQDLDKWLASRVVA